MLYHHRGCGSMLFVCLIECLPQRIDISCPVFWNLTSRPGLEFVTHSIRSSSGITYLWTLETEQKFLFLRLDPKTKITTAIEFH